MPFYDDDFYDEPSEFDQQVDEFKQSLMKSVRDEYKAEMDRLRKENAELQDVKRRKDEIEREHCHALNQFESDKLNLENRLKRMRLTELLGENLLIGWFPSSQDNKKPKCDKCDEQRRIHFKTPSGKPADEWCECAKSVRSYKPEEIECYQFYQSKNSWGGKYPTVSRYYQRKEDREYDSFEACKTPYGGEPFEEVTYWRVVFDSQEECQKYCDWLTAKEAEKQ
ncbi:hypothetical protein J41TS12_50490 [Paenibacillus antibioticophila]|uniref:Uncharacterized protein n=1 Tax=Paenibacillus antibioticophila TaxID=1274374 RepID=A0A919Y0V3_9BACL|nr:hypothetical protein [Paenibacillus antibioticophila]GIO40188.1 hypothetical protein J41TS12_50490 [Paenibacillus antibioticophila]